jgi:hypothetical protein
MGLLRVAGLILLLGSSVSAAASPIDIPGPLREGLERLRSARYGETLATAANLEENLQRHPLAHLITAEAYWGMIFCQTGHITAREIWHVAGTDASGYDTEFFEASEEALLASEAVRDQEPTEALGAFYLGLAHGVRARLFTLREQALKSGSEGKQMREALLEAVAKDPSLQADVYAGLGVYNYYADVLSPLIKLFRFFLLIPGGDREEGLQQLSVASQEASLLAPEARYELARILGIRENRRAEAFTLLQNLSDQFPDNALHALAASFQAEDLKRKDLAVEYARKAAGAAASMDDVCRVRVAPAAREALERLQGSSGR